MGPTIQHTLTSLEIAPPQGAWESLSARLDAEYDQPEIQLAQRMNEAVLTPPTGAWAAIAASLPVGMEPEVRDFLPVMPAAKEPAKLFSIPVRKIAVAAAVLIVVSFATWLLYPPSAKDPQGLQSSGPQASTQSEPPQVPASSPNALPPAPVIAQQTPPAVARPLPVNPGKPASDVDNEEEATTDNTNPDLGQPDLPSADPRLVRAQDVMPEANIPNRAYRDANGKVVMDMNLLTTPGNQYVTVTAPNGEQTRISRKFLPVLTFVNTGADNGQFNSTLKQKIQDLRKQLLHQASFVPSATNFLDIMELKELLQDK
ncbi:MAG: hypothetical protein J7578_00925 [Chitinophagaceae bacterium]|nr:hypothetical protein [Chitinophagaceae bacterium]